MFNEKISKIDDVFIEFNAVSFAQNKTLCNEVLTERIFYYNWLYVDVFNRYAKNVTEYLKRNEIINQENNSSQTAKVVRLLLFLESGTNLLDDKKQISDQEFKHYIRLNSDEKRAEWLKTLDYAENELGWKGIKKLNNHLQFIVSFYYDLELRIAYFGKFIPNMKKTGKKGSLIESSYNQLKSQVEPDYRIAY